MIFCARATRGRGLPSLDARNGGLIRAILEQRTRARLEGCEGQTGLSCWPDLETNQTDQTNQIDQTRPYAALLAAFSKSS